MEKKDGFLSVVKGFIIGIGSLVPGISSSSIMISLSSYEEFIKSLVNPFKKKDKALFLITIPLIIGIIIIRKRKFLHDENKLALLFKN